MNITLNLNPKWVRQRLIILTLCISIISLLTEYLVDFVIPPSTHILAFDFLNLFSVNLEGSFPTWYSTILLFVAAALLTYITIAKFQNSDNQRGYWIVLTLGFFYLSADEGAGIHEIFVDTMKQSFDVTGFFAFGWQIVAIPVVLIVLLLYVRFIIQLPTQTRTWLIISATIYLGGALIIEGISANQWYIDGGLSMRYLSIATIEETFEMLGAVLFIYTLLHYINQQAYTLTIEPTPLNQKRQILIIRQFSPIILLIGIFIALLGWMMIIAPHHVIPDDDNRETLIVLPFYYVIHDQILADGGMIVDMPGTFGVDNAFSRQLGRSLLAEYTNVTAVSQPTQRLTTIFATHNLLLNHDDLTDMLHSVGQTEFIIFDADTVEMLSAIP